MRHHDDGEKLALYRAVTAAEWAVTWTTEALADAARARDVAVVGAAVARLRLLGAVCPGAALVRHGGRVWVVDAHGVAEKPGWAGPVDFDADAAAGATNAEPAGEC